MQNKNKTLKSYSEEQDIKNIKKMREILGSLPPFCRQYFRGIETTTSARTRLGYAYDLRIFFEFLHENNPSLNTLPVTSYKISLLNDICKDDIEEYHARIVREVIKDVYGGIKYEPGSESNTNTDS